MARWCASVGGVLAACAAGALLVGCVVEERQGARGGSAVRAERPEPVAGGESAASYNERMSEPALNARIVNARMISAVQPLGTVPFDGQVLPLASPDGRRVATQIGEAPAWSALLGEKGSGPTLRTRIEVWDVSSAPISRVNLRGSLRGVMLGRSCDGEGFLVEEIRPDGSRRIGKASWETGEVRWLVEDGRVNAFGALLEDGGLAWCARDVEEGVFELMVNGRRVAGGPDVSYLFPMSGGARDVLYVLEASRFGLELQARSLTSARVEGVGEGGVGAGSYVLARRRVSTSPEAVLAYQAADPMRGCAGLADVWGESPPGLLMFNPGAGRMVVFDPAQGQVVMLVQGSIAGAWSRDEGGWAVVLTTPRGLEHQRVVVRDGLWEALPSARTLGDPYVARATAEADRPFVLIGPDPRDARRVSVVGMEFLRE